MLRSLSVTVAGESVRHFQSVGVLSWKPATAAPKTPAITVTVIIILRIAYRLKYSLTVFSYTSQARAFLGDSMEPTNDLDRLADELETINRDIVARGTGLEVLLRLMAE